MEWTGVKINYLRTCKKYLKESMAIWLILAFNYSLVLASVITSVLY
jgi:hypothetical protein